MDEIQRKYKARAVRRMGMWLYFIKDAIDFVNDCKEQGVEVWGLEAFRLFGRGIQPSMSNSLWMADSTNNYEKAIKFLSDPENQEYLYEIWYDEYCEESTEDE